MASVPLPVAAPTPTPTPAPTPTPTTKPLPGAAPPNASKANLAKESPGKPEAKAKMSPRTWLIRVGIGVFVVVAAGVATVWFMRPPEVSAVVVKFAPLVRTLQFSARVATASRVEIGSTVTGRVVQIAVTEGATVKKGDLLIRLESDELGAVLAQAAANERQAVARLSGLRTTGRSAAAAAVAQADSGLIAANAALKRTEDLTAKGFLSAASLDESRRAASVARAQLDAARAQANANADQGTDISQAEAQLALAASATTAVRARLTQTELLAPADAKILTRLVEPGQIVQPGHALLNIVLASPLQLIAQVDERYLEQLQIDQPATVLADAFPNQRFAARVLTIAPVVDPLKGAVEVKFQVATPPVFLREDMTLSVEVETARRERALVVPVDALQGEESSSTAIAMIAREGKVEARTVRTGIRTLDAAEILDGLADGEIVLKGDAPEVGKRVRANTEPADDKAKEPTKKNNVGSAKNKSAAQNVVPQ